VYTIENSLRDYKQTADKVGLIIDLAQMQVKSFDRHLATQLLKTMQANYVEQLAFCIIINAPVVFNVIYSIVSPFIDENTKQKIIITGNTYWDKLPLYFDKQHIPIEYGGSLDYAFKYETFY